MKAGTLKLPHQAEIDAATEAENAADPWLPSGISASFVGHECDRFIWYKLRHAYEREIDGLALRGMELGHAVEDLVIAWYRRAGYEVRDLNPRGKKERPQYGAYTLGGGLGGYLDFFVRGRDLGDRWHTASVKKKQSAKYERDENGHPTRVNGEKEGRWWLVSRRGMLNAAEGDYDQEQIYLGALRRPNESKPEQTNWQSLDFVGPDDEPPRRGLYIVVNPDTLQMHVELFEYDRKRFIELRQKAISIYRHRRAPDRVKEIPKWWPCEWCDALHVCHGATPMTRTCRTCDHARVVLPGDGPGVKRYSWTCAERKIPLDRKTDRERAMECPHYTPAETEEMF